MDTEPQTDMTHTQKKARPRVKKGKKGEICAQIDRLKEHKEIHVEECMVCTCGNVSGSKRNIMPYIRLHKPERPRDFHSKPSCCQDTIHVAPASKKFRASRTGKL